MGKEPWEKEIVTEEKKISRKTRDALINTHWLTAILSVFFIIMLIILFIVFYTSNRGDDKATETSGFYSSTSTKTSTVRQSSSSTTSQTSEETSESTSSSETTESSEATGETITVLAGEGASSVASRAGISVSQLESLNPSHMTKGYWYADPGDVVKIK